MKTCHKQYSCCNKKDSGKIYILTITEEGGEVGENFTAVSHLK